MKFKNLSIKKFRGIKKLEIEDFSRVNLFLGKNNCGKSSILEAIFLLTGFNIPQNVLKIDSFRSLIHSETNDFRFVYYNLNYTQTPILYSELNEREAFRRLSILPKSDSIKFKQGVNIKNENLLEKSSTDSYEFDSINGITFVAESKYYQKSLVSHNITLTAEKDPLGTLSFKSNSDTKFKNDFRGIFLHSNSRNSLDYYQRIEKLIVERKKDQLLQSLKTIDPKITDISLGSNNMLYFDINATQFIPAHLMGDGIWKFMNIISSLNEVKDGILLIDEIDNGLHYTSLKNLWKAIISISKQNNIQLFITTHSHDALKYLTEVVEESDSIEDKNLVRCYTIMKLQDDTVKSYKYDFDSLEFAMETDLEIRGDK